ncbi:hypothetical protein ACPOL_1922 [Acidisarcina polymorpha]|uniref:Uncharacterized protein n=1 Tax=Acidisarcina polymorpha TaxID=2211140 RepID=A0A2Z5FWL6_9BACT|nr:hypothetical protein ACPOL_1922 [Acidisarcina polymorpha]
MRIDLRIQEAKQLLFIMLAKRCANSHVAQDRTGDARRKAVRRCVAAGTILSEDAVSVIILRSCLVCS